MALLTRFIRLPDRANTHVFTFVVTRSVTRDLHRDVTSKEFCYGYHRWAITFSRAGKVLGVYLVWRNPSEVIAICYFFIKLSIKSPELIRLHFQNTIINVLGRNCV